jgi:heme/copper-type cytochrome/quinol oxidase subunit 4
VVVSIAEGVVADDGHPVCDQSDLIVEDVFLVFQAFLRVLLHLIYRFFHLQRLLSRPALAFGVLEILKKVAGALVGVLWVISGGASGEEHVGRYI